MQTLIHGGVETPWDGSCDILVGVSKLVLLALWGSSYHISVWPQLTRHDTGRSFNLCLFGAGDRNF